MKFKEGLRWRPSREQFAEGVRGVLAVVYLA